MRRCRCSSNSSGRTTHIPNHPNRLTFGNAVLSRRECLGYGAALGRSMGLDVVSSHELGRDGTSDEVQLAFAVAQQRCMVTFDRIDYQRLAREYEARGRGYFGILLLSPAFESGP